MNSAFWKAAWPRKQIILGPIVIALFMILNFPYAISTYHLESGARLLEKAPVPSDVATQDAIVQHLQRALKWDDRNSQAYRLLGKAYTIQDQPARAAQALTTFVQSRPEHQLGQLEWTKACRTVKTALAGMIYADLLQVERSLVSEPSSPVPHPFQPSDYVRTTTLDLFSDNRPVPALFLHPVSAITYTLSLTQPAFLRFAMGNILRTPASGSDGITFAVYANDRRLFLEHLAPEMAQQGWQECEVDLSEFVGQTIALRLMTTPGSVGDVTADWAVWSRPRVEAPEAKAYRQVLETCTLRQ